jgi:hypothetical protein
VGMTERLCIDNCMLITIPKAEGVVILFWKFWNGCLLLYCTVLGDEGIVTSLEMSVCYLLY